MKWFRILVLGVLAFACLNGPFLMGQSGGGSVVGTIHDPSGAKASITLTNVETSTSLDTKSSSSGEYVFPLVPVGTYALTVSAPGFERVEQRNVSVGLNKTVEVNEALPVGTATATVQVKGLASQLETTTSQAATTIDQKTFDDLPIALTGAARSVNSVASGSAVPPARTAIPRGTTKARVISPVAASQSQ